MHIKKLLSLLVLIVLCRIEAGAQLSYGTTGLLNMPTAEMQKDKTLMFGGNWLNKHAAVPRWWYDTWNYYVNITIFPWFEVGYLCTGHKAVPTDYGNRSGYWVPSTYGRFINQDRSFHFRLRAWKEGWWKKWTPQIVLGANDAIGDSWNGGSLTYTSEAIYSNGFLNRYYLAITKHFTYLNVGTLGVHFAWIYSKRLDNKLNDPAVGANFRFELLDDSSLFHKLLNGVNIMSEIVPGYTDVREDLTFDPKGTKYQVNIGLGYSIWREHITFVGELNKMKYFSCGIIFKIHLK